LVGWTVNTVTVLPLYFWREMPISFG